MQIAICIKPEERELIKEAAKRERRTMSDFIRLVVLDKIASNEKTPNMTP